MTPKEFISKYKWPALLNGVTSGVPPSITLAQASLESGWGRYAICNNLFGIKAANWSGSVCDSSTTEWNGAGYQAQTSAFRAYGSPYGSFADHAKFLKENSRYDFLFDLDAIDYIGWANGLQSAGYATAPDYAQKLINLIESNNLGRMDWMVPTVKTAILIGVSILVFFLLKMTAL